MIVIMFAVQAQVIRMKFDRNTFIVQAGSAKANGR